MSSAKAKLAGAVFLVFLWAVSSLAKSHLKGSAEFLKADTQTQGNWKGVYGSEGYNIFEHAENYPSYAKVSSNQRLREIWSPSSKDARALLKQDSNEDRFIARWYRWSREDWTLTVQLNDRKQHQIALYCVDWEKREPRTQKIEVLDMFSRAVLDTQTVSDFFDGKYLLWNVRGDVIFRFTSIQGDGSVVSGMFFDPASAGDVK